MGMDSKTLREQSSLKRAVGLKRERQISCILRKHINYVIICLSISKGGKRTIPKAIINSQIKKEKGNVSILPRFGRRQKYPKST